MLELRLILCPIDFSEFSIRAYQHALSLAEHYRAKVAVLHVVEISHYPYADYVASTGDYAQFCGALHAGGKEKLREFVTKQMHNLIQPELVVQEGVAPDCILSFAEARKADLIVMGTHGRRGFDRLVLGSVTDRVMRRAACPVIAISKLPREPVAADVAAAGEKRRHVHHLSRILFCTDFSRNSERALHFAASLAEEYDAELTLLHVLEEVPSADMRQKAIARATEQLDKLIAGKDRKFKTAVRIGKPFREIIQLAEEMQIDLVAMGVSGRGALDRAVFGSTTYRVIQLGPCPVLAVHS